VTESRAPAWVAELGARGPVVLASRKRGKLAELQALGRGVLDLRLAPDDAPEVEENGSTYLENALAKAQAIARFTGAPALADDSGLEVEALGGAPGVRSARYGGPGLDDAGRCRLLLEALSGSEIASSSRRARFVCVLVLADGDGWLSAEGFLEGEITREPRGARGFGYDPVFAVASHGGRTLAEIDEAEKNRLSHRAAAMHALLAKLRPSDRTAT